ncbi:hypothetical protein ACAW74_11030 [Fibrella sp. WM1]|uniref:hypothetical protein n=1 Tax=Fibrella musci TaxID=3242485 RepID=UPI0035211277
MKKLNLFLFLLFIGVATTGFTFRLAPDDFYAGKWDIMIVGTPNGDAKMVADLVRKDGKLTGQLTPSDANAEKIPIESIEESANKLNLTFTAQGYNVTMELNKVDDDNLKGSIMNGMFNASAKRIKN